MRLGPDCNRWSISNHTCFSPGSRAPLEKSIFSTLLDQTNFQEHVLGESLSFFFLHYSHTRTSLHVKVSEDCLYLNIFVPVDVNFSSPLRSPMPVMVWIHGGDFIAGSASKPLYDGRFISNFTRTVVVNLEYRLGERAAAFCHETATLASRLCQCTLLGAYENYNFI